MRPLWKKVVAHFDCYRTLDRWPFFWRVTIESQIVPWLLMAVIGLFVHFPPIAPFLPRNVPKYLFIAVIAGPLWELILWQWLPVMIARRFKVRFWNQVWISLAIFFLPHFGNGVFSAIKGGLFGGFYSVFTYVCWREKSLGKAFYMTYTQHALHNLIAIAIWWYQTSR
jgi:hypothetical protein